MSILSVENVTKTYGEKVLFDDLSFTIDKEQHIGLLGVNGTGKSTLLKVLAKRESVDHGKIIHANSFHIEYLPQQPELDEQLTVLEQIYYGDSTIMVTMREYEQALIELEQNPQDEAMQKKFSKCQQQMDAQNAWDANTVAKQVLTRLGITEFTKQVKYLSGGQKKRVAIAKALIQPADLLLLDEPTNHLDHDTIEWLEQFLSQYRRAFIVVTHDRYFLNRITNQIFELDKGKLYIYEGNYETYLEQKALREEEEQSREAKRQNLLRRELAWLRRGARARTTKQKARIDRIKEIQSKEAPTKTGELDFAIGSTRLGKKVIELTNITKSFGEKTLLNHFDYLVTPNDRIGIVGANGSGKTTLLNMMAGRIEPDQGTITIGETVKIGYYTQSDEEINGDLKIIQYIKEVAEIVRTVDGHIITAEQMLERFLFPRSQQWTYIRRLSGGEKRRLYLLKILMTEPNVLFLDEPTNDLDTQTLSILEDYLEQFPGVVITVSHDRYFLDRVVDKLIVFQGEGNVSTYYGSYSEYMEERKLEEAFSEKVEKQRKQQTVEKPKKKKLSYHEQREWETIEDEIMELEMKKATIEEEIVQAGSDFEKINALYEQQKEIDAKLEAKFSRWEELSLLVEQIEKGES